MSRNPSETITSTGELKTVEGLIEEFGTPDSVSQKDLTEPIVKALRESNVEQIREIEAYASQAAQAWTVLAEGLSFSASSIEERNSRS
jgi:hypothetical protein